MMGRLLVYYSLLIPWSMLFFFGAEFFQLIFELFLILATIMLPYTDNFLKSSLKKFPGFLMLSFVLFTFIILTSDFAVVASEVHPYLSVLLVIPIYFAFRLVSYPWQYVKRGLVSPKSYLKTNNVDNWLILSVISVLAIAFHFSPASIFFLAPLASLFIHSNLQSIRI